MANQVFHHPFYQLVDSELKEVTGYYEGKDDPRQYTVIKLCNCMSNEHCDYCEEIVQCDLGDTTCEACQ